MNRNARRILPALVLLGLLTVGTRVMVHAAGGQQDTAQGGAPTYSRAYLHSYNLNSSGLAIEGYCPVTYHIHNVARQGSPSTPPPTTAWTTTSSRPQPRACSTACPRSTSPRTAAGVRTAWPSRTSSPLIRRTSQWLTASCCCSSGTIRSTRSSCGTVATRPRTCGRLTHTGRRSQARSREGYQASDAEVRATASG
jgi:hypothetical protein